MRDCASWSKQVWRVNIFCHGVLLGFGMSLQVKNVCRAFYSHGFNM